MFNGKIDVAKGFQTSINIAYDLNNDDKVRGFIPAQSSLDIIEDILLSTADNSTDRARILIGAYGRGKSHIILVLMALLSRSKKDKPLFESLLAKMKDTNRELYDYANRYLESEKKLLPVIIRGSSSSLSSSFLNALQLTLNEDGLSDVMPETHFQAAIAAIETWKRDFKKTYTEFTKMLGKPVNQFVLTLKEYDVTAYERFVELYPKLTSGSAFNPFLGFDIVELFEDVAKTIKTKGYSGIYVVYDEFSKYLESSIANATISDVKLLQDFAEKCTRSGVVQMHLLLICHKDIANYIDGGLPKDKVDGWRGISGRFKHVNLHNNYAQMYEIISAVINKEPKYWDRFQKDNAVLFAELSDRFVKNRLLDSNNETEVRDAVFGCYPLHPISTFILPRLSERVAQNERTLFTFLSADDRYTLSAFLVGDGGKFPLLTPDYLYDYFEPLLRKEPYTSEVHKLYRLAATVLQKVEPESLEAKVLKTIALIYLVEQFEKLPPVIDIISDAFRDTVKNPKDISSALVSLIEKECVVYLKRSNGYLQIKKSSGVNIAAEISSFVEKRQAVLKATKILNQSAFDSYMYPTSYNDRFEITRYFDFVFITGKDFLAIEDFETRLKKPNDDGIIADGVIYAVIGQSQSELRKIESVVKKAVGFPDRMIVILPTEYVQIENEALEYEALKTLRASVPEDDPILADEYDIRIDDLTEVIGAFINNYARPEYGKAKYYYQGIKQQIYRKAQLSGLLSRICQGVFKNTPVINNETINKDKVTSQALNSRTRILTGLLENELKPNLGLVGTGQEVSIMRSTLIQTGVLISSDENPRINLEPQDEKMANLLMEIQNFFTGTLLGDKASFGLLYDRLILPEHGIGLKRGIIPIYIATVLHLNKKNLVIMHGNKEERITPDLLNGINERPPDYSIIMEDWSEEKATYLAALEEVFKKHIIEREKIYNGFAYLLSAMNRWYMALPKYAKELNEEYRGRHEKPRILARSNIKFINSLKLLDNNPREYLFERLATIFELRNQMADLAGLIGEAKTERDNAVHNLLIILSSDVKQLFSIHKTDATLASVIKDWYETLNERTMKRLFANSENQILNLLSVVGNDELMFIQRLAKAVSGLRVEDWTSETIIAFLNDLTAFKETVDEFNNQNPSKRKSSAEYKVVFTDENGEETVRVFDKARYSETATLMLGEVSRVVDEYNQSVTEQEKRQVLMDVLENLCKEG